MKSRIFSRLHRSVASLFSGEGKPYPPQNKTLPCESSRPGRLSQNTIDRLRMAAQAEPEPLPELESLPGINYYTEF